jgi:hypothetical protein
LKRWDGLGRLDIGLEVWVGTHGGERVIGDGFRWRLERSVVGEGKIVDGGEVEVTLFSCSGSERGFLLFGKSGEGSDRAGLDEHGKGWRGGGVDDVGRSSLASAKL